MPIYGLWLKGTDGQSNDQREAFGRVHLKKYFVHNRFYVEGILVKILLNDEIIFSRFTPLPRKDQGKRKKNIFTYILLKVINATRTQAIIRTEEKRTETYFNGKKHILTDRNILYCQIA